MSTNEDNINTNSDSSDLNNSGADRTARVDSLDNGVSVSSQTSNTSLEQVASILTSSSPTMIDSGNEERNSFVPLRFSRQNNWRENLTTNLSSVIQEFRPVFQSNHNVNNNTRHIITNLSNYRLTTNTTGVTNSDSFVINLDNSYSNAPQGNSNSSNDSTFPNNNDEQRPNVNIIIENQNEEQERNDINLSETLAQLPEAASTITRYLPYICILLAKSCYDHIDGILDFFALGITFCHANKILRQEVIKQGQRKMLLLIRELIYIIVVTIVIGFMLERKNIPLSLLVALPATETFTLKRLLFAVGINDLILKLITVSVKIMIALFPSNIIEYNGRGRIYLLIEAFSQMYRALNPIQAWLLFLLNSYIGTEKIVGVVLSGAYIIAKGADLLQRAKFFKKSIIKFMHKTPIGNKPAKEQISEAGQCTICHDDFASPTMLDCGHIFCELCIGTWLQRSSICPLCRARVSDDPSYKDGATTFFLQLY